MREKIFRQSEKMRFRPTLSQKKQLKVQNFIL